MPHFGEWHSRGAGRYGLSIYPSGAYVANSTQKLVCRDFQGQLLRLGGPLLITELFKCVSPGAALQAAAVIAELEVHSCS